MLHFLFVFAFLLISGGDAKCFFKVGRTKVPIFCHGNHRLYTGKFSAGTKEGLLCHNVKKSAIEILTPPDNYRSQKLSFCETEKAEMLVGDFNGDGLSDLMCREPGKKLRVCYANKDGVYKTDAIYEFKQDFCPLESGDLAVVNLNGDKEQDIICHHNTGEFSYAYGRKDGTFPTSVFLHIDWCTKKDSLLLFGDFNGDGITDLLCHNTKDGSKAISLGENDNLLSSKAIEFNMNWCNGPHEPFTTVSDVNGDGMDDLICKDKSPFGETKVAHAQKDVIFTPQDVYKVNFCINGGRGNFYTGDFNGDGKSDLLCQTFFGTREIDISGCV